MNITQGSHSIVIKLYDKNTSAICKSNDNPVPKCKVLILLDAVPLEGEEKTTDSNGEAHFSKTFELICNVDKTTNNIYLQGGQIFIDGIKIYDGAILPEMNFYI